MKPALALVLFAVALAGQNTTWPKEPDGFKGAKFLMSKSEVVRVRDLNEDSDCFADSDIQGVEGHCNDNVTADDRSWKVKFWFVNDQLIYVTGVFDLDTFAKVKRAFLAKYGMPNVRTPVAQDQLLWRGRKAMLYLTNDGSFLLALLSAANADSRKSAEAMGRALEP
jgi:hypothetical protein